MNQCFSFNYEFTAGPDDRNYQLTALSAYSNSLLLIHPVHCQFNPPEIPLLFCHFHVYNSAMAPYCWAEQVSFHVDIKALRQRESLCILHSVSHWGSNMSPLLQQSWSPLFTFRRQLSGYEGYAQNVQNFVHVENATHVLLVCRNLEGQSFHPSYLGHHKNTCRFLNEWIFFLAS